MWPTKINTCVAHEDLKSDGDLKCNRDHEARYNRDHAPTSAQGNILSVSVKRKQDGSYYTRVCGCKSNFDGRKLHSWWNKHVKCASNTTAEESKGVG